MKLTVLGNDSTTVSPGGACSLYLLEAGGERILLDMGNGSIFNLKKVIALADIDAIILTHLHFDHMADLMLFRYEREGRKYLGEEIIPIDLYTPQPAGWLMEKLEKGDLFSFHMIRENQVVRRGALMVEFIRVLHPVETYALRFTHEGRVFTYSADTGICEGIQTAAEGADLLLCEATYRASESYVIPNHLSGREAGELARDAQVKRLILTHLPEGNRDDLLKEARAVHRDTELSGILGVYEV